MPRGHSLVAALLLAIILCSTVASGQRCGPKSIFVRGRAESAPSDSSVSVKLVYEHGKVGESDHLLLDGGSFRPRIQFSTLRYGGCARQPLHVIVALLNGDQEIDQVTLNVPQDFNRADPSELATKEDVILRGK